MYDYNTKGTCSTKIFFDIIDGRVRNISFKDGCNGNLKALGILAEGMEARELVAKLKGLKCGKRETSCGDQLARAVEKYSGKE
ncbi:MAG: TIGR03905 family TSCPD domain-containing protein [Treponema sp.]|nr:TIGR03905 family TSCPD domain-containing protein [Treponema sp.]